jgi:Mn-dependent DtxR family transcriptional regulator
LTVEKNGNLVLTDRGETLANSIFERHQVITEYLIHELGLDPRIAEDDVVESNTSSVSKH